MKLTDNTILNHGGFDNLSGANDWRSFTPKQFLDAARAIEAEVLAQASSGNVLMDSYNAMVEKKLAAELQASEPVREAPLAMKFAINQPVYAPTPPCPRYAELEKMVVMEFSEEEIPTFSQGLNCHEILEVVTAERCNGLVKKIQELEALLDECEIALELNMTFMETPAAERKIQPWTHTYDALAKLKNRGT